MIQCLGDDPSIPQALKGDRSTDDRGKVCDKRLLSRIRTIVFHREICRGRSWYCWVVTSYKIVHDILGNAWFGSFRAQVVALDRGCVLVTTRDATHADIK
jgi:hypothetical protein